MNRLALSGAFLFAVVASGWLTARADTVYDNGPPDQTTGWEMTQWIEADDFTLLNSTRVESITFWDFELAGYFQGQVVWQIYSNAGNNTPGTLLSSGTSTNLVHSGTGVSPFGAYMGFVNTFDIAPVCLPAGTYWLALHNGPLSYTSSRYVFWFATYNTGLNPSQSLSPPFSGPWQSNEFPGLRSELAFQINGTPGPKIVAVAMQSRIPKISFSTVAGQNYRLEYKNKLSDPVWLPVAGAATIAGSGLVMQISDPDPNVVNLSQRFYRVVLL